MLMQLTPVGSGASNWSLLGESYPSTSNTTEHSPPVSNDIIPNLIHDLRNMLTTLNSGVRILLLSIDQKRREILFGGLDLSVVCGLERTVAGASVEGEKS